MMKGWTKPKLIVLFRGRPEERVLSVCKDTTISATTPYNDFESRCSVSTGPDCGVCSAQSNS